MTTIMICKQLQQIQLAYSEWQENQWRTFTLEQFFRNDFDEEQADKEVEYSLEDAKDVYHSQNLETSSTPSHDDLSE